jgi:putative nucleotidyltransferase with HDIG domain
MSGRMEDRRLDLADQFVRRFAAAVRSAQLYSARHPIIARNVEALSAAIDVLHASQPTITVGIVGSEVVVGDVPVGKAESLGDVIRRLQSAGIERIVIERGVSADEVAGLVQALASIEARRTSVGGPPDFPTFPHIRVGRIQVEDRVEGNLADMATIRRLYADAVSMAGLVWESASADHQPDPTAARAMIDGLAQAVAQNRTALVALTALKQYDNYTFTHMVNVSILTMGQARGLGIDGPLLREFGLAALMHDIGKVKTPAEILNKPDKLTDAEFAIMKRHVVDGAEILRGTPEIPVLAPVVAFEHHLRMDGTGYPNGVARGSLNICTMLCSIADVYDAMRSQRRYQQAFPTDRILEVLKRNDGTQFDQNLVRRFVQLIGIYPAGNLVRLDSGEIAVVVKTYAPDPYRPQVRVLFDSQGKRLSLPLDVNLWETAGNADGRPTGVRSPVDPADYGIDPLALI